MSSLRRVENRVRRVYEALRAGDGEAVQGALAGDLEWWFHGPPQCEYLKRILTGEGAPTSFAFIPRSVTALSACTVVAEGAGTGGVYWVHVWTVGAGGLLTGLREYFNTSLLVRHVAEGWQWQPQWQSSSSLCSASSMPGLVLAL